MKASGRIQYQTGGLNKNSMAANNYQLPRIGVEKIITTNKTQYGRSFQQNQRNVASQENFKRGHSSGRVMAMTRAATAAADNYAMPVRGV